MSGNYLDTTHDSRAPDVLSNPSFATREGLGGTMVSQPKTLSDGWTTQGWQTEMGDSPVATNTPQVLSPGSDKSFGDGYDDHDRTPPTSSTVPVASGTHKLPELNLDFIARPPVSPTSSLIHHGQCPFYFKKKLEISKDESGTIGLCFQGPVVTKVDSGSPADNAGVEAGTRMSKINDVTVPCNMGSYEVQQLISNAPSVVNITFVPLRDEDEEAVNFDAWTEGDESSLDLGETFHLSTQQAACSVITLIFIVTPVLVLLLSVIAGSFLAVMLDWPWEDAFWVCGAVTVSPLGGAPVLRYEDHVKKGGRIFIAVLAAWSVGLFGVMQLLLAPAIGPLFTWTIEMKNKMRDKPMSPTSPQVRMMSAWRLRTGGTHHHPHPQTARGARRQPLSSRMSRSPWGLGRRSSMRSMRSSIRPPDTARSNRSIRSPASQKSDNEMNDKEEFVASTATGDAL
eukprot:TRINITY_DN3820_c0_g1_i1.p1 TRINITY_DN3820_c0_g1~~TRINITY_DN3820_c0_g1_i1.p1  ORF type:complete len:469 (+),score=112.35 TRINITY_DN3820_c0_g1_i1:46-1407(+)